MLNVNASIVRAMNNERKQFYLERTNNKWKKEILQLIIKGIKDRLEKFGKFELINTYLFSIRF